MPLEVIGAGFGRTGTASLMQAMEILYAREAEAKDSFDSDYGSQINVSAVASSSDRMIDCDTDDVGNNGTHRQKQTQNKKQQKLCYHFMSIINRPNHARHWIDLVSNKINHNEMPWDEIYEQENFAATFDHPSANFYQELLHHYPNAKVILSHHPRGKEGWYESKLAHQRMMDTLDSGYWPKFILDFAYFVMTRKFLQPSVGQSLSSSPSSPSSQQHQKERNIWSNPFTQFVSTVTSLDDIVLLGNKTRRRLFGEEGIYDRQHALQVYDDWYQNVSDYVPSEQLLVYNVTMGWEPLCEFLELPVPQDVPFPRATAHSSKNISLNMIQLKAFGHCCNGVLWSCKYVLPFLLIWTLWKRTRRFTKIQ